tara:strand:+ start:1077 stop:1565 length:489 start_codon:yes stop_codon:yes gene_type:complete
MPTYSFKSSGFLNRNTDERVNAVTLKPIGIKTPLEFSRKNQDSLFSMHYKVIDQIHDNLRNLLLTNPGERLGRHDYGAGLREMTMEMISSENYEHAVMMRIKNTVDIYMPFIDLDSFGIDDIVSTPYELQGGMSKVTVTISYNVPKLSIVNKRLQLILYVAG